MFMSEFIFIALLFHHVFEEVSMVPNIVFGVICKLYFDVDQHDIRISSFIQYIAGPP